MKSNSEDHSITLSWNMSYRVHTCVESREMQLDKKRYVFGMYIN